MSDKDSLHLENEYQKHLKLLESENGEVRYKLMKIIISLVVMV